MDESHACRFRVRLPRPPAQASCSHTLAETYPGGYTRVLHHPGRRLGDNSDLVLVELVGAKAPAEAGEADSKETPADSES